MKYLSFFLIGCWLAFGAWASVQAQSVELDMEWEYLSPQATATPGDRDPNAHVVSRGETLYGIARQYGLSLEQLTALNRLESEVIYPGQRLVVGRPQPAAYASSYGTTATYERANEAPPATVYSRRPFPDPAYATTATRGYERAVQAYGRSSAEPTYRSAPPQGATARGGYYAQASGEPALNSSPAYEPQLSRTATYRTAATPSPSLQARQQQARSMGAASNGASIRRSYYQVAQGDDIFSVADQFGVSVSQLREWNKIAQVEPGKVIVVNQWRIDETGEAGTPNNLRQARMPAGEAGASPTQVGTLGVLGQQPRSRGMEPTGEAPGEYVGNLSDLWQQQPAQPAMNSRGMSPTPSAGATQRTSQAAEPAIDYSPLGLDMARVPYLEVNTPPRGTSSRFFALHSYLPQGSEVQVVLPGQQGVLTLEVAGRLPAGSEIELGLSPAVVRLIEAAGGSERITLVYPE